jgi:hypothetical protein
VVAVKKIFRGGIMIKFNVKYVPNETDVIKTELLVFSSKRAITEWAKKFGHTIVHVDGGVAAYTNDEIETLLKWVAENYTDSGDIDAIIKAIRKGLAI